MSIAHLPTTLRKARHDRNLSLHQAAELAGLSYSAISDIECGKRQPTLETLEKLAVAYGLELTVNLGPAGSSRLGELVLSVVEIRELRRLLHERRIVYEAVLRAAHNEEETHD